MTSRAAAPPPATTAAPGSGLQSWIDLYPHEWAYASWRPVADPPGMPPPFDPAHGLRSASWSEVFDWYRSAPPFEGPLSAEEAAAWLWASYDSRSHAGALPEARERFMAPDALDLVRQRDPLAVAAGSRLPRGLAMNCLASVMKPSVIATRLVEETPSRRLCARRAELIAGVRAFLMPRLTPAERDALAAAVRDRLATVRWPTSGSPPDDAFLLATQVGLHDELQAEVDSWPDGRYRDDARFRDPGWEPRPHAVVLGLGSPEAVRSAFARLELSFHHGWHLAGFLAHTGTADLPDVLAQVAAATPFVSPELMEVLARVHDVAAVAPMLGWMRTSEAPRTARDWLAAHPLEVLVGAARLLDRPGRTRDHAVDLLQARIRTGADVAAALPFLDAADAARLTGLAAEHEVLPELGPAELPPDLARDLAGAVPRRELPDWIDVPALPPAPVGGRGRLADDVVRTVLRAATVLQRGTTAAPPLLATVRAHADSDALAWALVEAWLHEGAPPDGRWAFRAAGHLGGDRTATRLAPLIRTWPHGGGHHRAVLGLEVLAAIGSDTALLLLSDIARRVKYKSLRTRAREAMAGIAEAQGLTRDELEDRIVPDGGLDGPRQFSVVLGPGLRPMVRDAAGRVRASLPRPNAGDDPAPAAAAAEEWKLLKKVVGDLVEVQSARLEQAMVIQRRWTPADFDRFLVRHPLQRHLTRLLVWGAWSPDGSLAATFRVTDELDLADAGDEPFEPGPDHGIGVVHPLHLTPVARAEWGDLLADDGVVPPFPQFGRPLHDVEDDERTATDLTRFAGRKVGAVAMSRTLEDRGWERGVERASGMVRVHAKPFPVPGVTAVVEYDYSYDGNNRSIEHCYVLPRVVRSAQELGRETRGEPLVVWGGVDPIIRCEVLADLHALNTRAHEEGP